MALFNCKLTRNITLNQPGDGGDSGCEGQDISVGVGGLRSPVLVYNISDVPSLKFENDNRADDSLTVDTINSTGQFYKIDFTSATYQEEYDPSTHKWTHNLELEIANITSLFEDLLADGVNGRYLVCFKPNGSEDYRMFGWKFGAKLDYSMNISTDSLGYTVTLEDVSEYPLFTVYADNFGHNNKTYTPIFKPLYDTFLCEQSSGRHTGYAIAMYVVKVNSAGQPLGSDNRLIQWTGLKQDAYKYSGISSDGDFNIIGTYNSSASFDGHPVRIYDLDKCPANVTNSLYINSKKAETISLNSTISARTITITSTDEWMMVDDPQFVTISPVEGGNGNTTCTIYHNGVGGVEDIRFMNKETREIVTLTVNVNIISIGTNYVFDASIGEIVLTPSVNGCSTAYTYTISPSVTNSKDSYGFLHIFPSVSTTTNYNVTLTHSCDQNEVKIVYVEVVVHTTTPNNVLQTSFCQINSSGQYTNYRTNVYLDINPYSPTFGDTSTTTTWDATCSTNPATWQNVGSYCEVNGGLNTGYLVVQEMDTNPDSPTYGQTRETKTYNPTQCPAKSSGAMWVLDGRFTPYCEMKVYTPSGVEGNSGRMIARLIDENKYSSTYGQTQESGLTENDWDATLQQMYGDFPCEAPDIRPQIEEINYNCVLEETSDGQLWRTGEVDVTGIDKNTYSATYMQTMEIRRTDEERCPPSNPNKCACSALTIGTTSISFPQSGTSRTVGFSLTSGCELAWTSVSWLTIVNNGNGTLTITAPANSSTDRREGAIVFSVGRNNNCHTIFVDQDGDTPTPPPTPTSAVTINFRGVSGTISSGGLMVTGSSYTAEFSLAYNTGTLYGTLADDPRTAMTFYGQFVLEGTGGGNIRNECGSEQGEIYAVTSASWDVSTNTLNVGVSKCTS